MKYLVLAFVLLMIVAAVPVSADENEYGVVKAWFNGENATVKNVNLKLGEPVEIKVEVISRINGHVSLKLNEPGETNAFDVLSGPSKMDEMLRNLNVEPEWKKTYTWILSPNGKWKNGNAPINIFVQFTKEEGNKKIQFSISNPYILDEQYSGATLTPEKTTEAASNQTQSDAKHFPYSYIILAGAVIIVLVIFKLKK